MKRLVGLGGFWFAVSVAGILAAVTLFSFLFWDWLDGSASETIRNVGLVAGGVIVMLLAFWRSKIAERQAESARRQVDTTQQGFLNDRYQKGAEMLGSDALTVRLGGIYALQRLDNEHPEQYHIQIMKLFCAFVRRPTVDEYDNIGETAQPKSARESDAEEKPCIREDVQAAMEAIGYRSKKGITLEKEAFEINLNGASLRYAKLNGVNLSGALFGDADLSHAEFNPKFEKANLSNAVFGPNANLSGAKFICADLSGAGLAGTRLPKANLLGAILSGVSFIGADLSKTELAEATLVGAHLEGANLSGATLYICNTRLDGSVGPAQPATGLTKDQLNEACANLGNPPIMDGFVLDAETGEPLVWGGQSIGI